MSITTYFICFGIVAVLLLAYQGFRNACITRFNREVIHFEAWIELFPVTEKNYNMLNGLLSKMYCPWSCRKRKAKIKEKLKKKFKPVINQEPAEINVTMANGKQYKIQVE